MRCLEPRRQARACYFRAFFASLDVKSVSRFRASPAAMLTLSPVPPFSLFAPPSIHQRPRGCTRLLTALSARHPARSTPPLPATRLPSPTWAPSDLLTSPSGPRRSARRNVRHRLMRGSRLPSRHLGWRFPLAETTDDTLASQRPEDTCDARCVFFTASSSMPSPFKPMTQSPVLAWHTQNSLQGRMSTLPALQRAEWAREARPGEARTLRCTLVYPLASFCVPSLASTNLPFLLLHSGLPDAGDSRALVRPQQNRLACLACHDVLDVRARKSPRPSFPRTRKHLDGGRHALRDTHNKVCGSVGSPHRRRSQCGDVSRREIV
ncbi:hypothetical protein BKA93DRAFT_103793 [Sparassis latifolia]